MGFGKKKEDGVKLGFLKAMPWEREPLTEVQPLRDVAPPSGLDDRGTVKSAAEQDTDRPGNLVQGK
jgi:hypothetical protein